MTNRQPESVLNSRNLKHVGLLLEVAAELMCQWIQASGRSRMNKYYRDKYEKDQFDKYEKDQFTSFRKKPTSRVERSIKIM